ncbi:PDR/VanB family oxidoreductase [Pseudonocardia sp. CA-142604]|uniref:PDR/VanB family oxidoreductase n=1 Tax=Pseudonocardia sp. CA-142604 TaxID=3240024 RepID=UPI003D92914F
MRLRGAAGEQPLPAWSPGAHIDVVLPSGLVRQYSLCGDPGDPEYTIAVLREPNGRGGSAEIHDSALVGRQLRIQGPRNRFELEPAPSYVFVAGGIGITPLLPMIRETTARGLPWQLHYGGRRRDTMAFTTELHALAAHPGAELTLYSDDLDGPLPLPAILDSAPRDAALFACGPAGMLAAVRTAAEQHRPGLQFRFEQFSAEPSEVENPAEPATEDAPYEVELSRTGETVMVQPGQSILDAVRPLRPEILSSCEEGFCGTCETKVLEGVPVHRDTILSAKERARNTSMMICVGGCASARLVLDL